MDTACGRQSAAVGPLYCPASFGVYLDSRFFAALSRAQADRDDPAGKNARSVRFELQADCLAGVWMHHVYKQDDLTDADPHDALNAAAVAGDDFSANAPGAGRPPEDWTHGSSAQRQHWLKTGFTEGEPAACDTFSARA
jgi:predicted metalloprotease